VPNPKAKKKRIAENMHRIAESMTNLKDAEIVRAYAAEIKAAERAGR
jgi:hypothetical protein